MRAALLVALAAVSLNASTFYVTVAGLGGEEEYEQRFAGWAKDIEKTLQAADPDAQVLTLHGPEATKANFKTLLENVAQRTAKEDALVLMLIGHGTFDGVVYKFNLPGPDVTAAELAAWLDRIPASRQLVVNMTSASGASIEALARPERVVITATRTGTEKNATVFARHWSDALRDPAADTDKNETISALEAFRYAEQKTARFYEGQKRLATEHARLEGDLASSFAVVRFGQASAAYNDPARRGLLARKEELEQQIEMLKLQKAAMPFEQYRKQLTALLLDLAKLQEELDR